MDASRSPPEPGTIFVVLQGRVSRAEMRWHCERVRFLLEERGAGPVVFDVSGVDHPDAGILDCLARMLLTAKRSGGSMAVRDACPELRDLLDLAGLSELLG